MYTEDWASQNFPVWSTVLKEFVGKPVKGIEIGSFEGRSTVWFMENIFTHPSSHMDCVDPYLPYLEPEYGLNTERMAEVEKRFYENTKPFSERITTHKMLSADYLRERNRPADFIYIDGDHTSAGCLTDAVLSHQVLSSGGIMIFDDALWGGLREAPNLPRGAILSFTKCFSEYYNLLASGYQVILKKI